MREWHFRWAGCVTVAHSPQTRVPTIRLTVEILLNHTKRRHLLQLFKVLLGRLVAGGVTAGRIALMFGHPWLQRSVRQTRVGCGTDNFVRRLAPRLLLLLQVMVWCAGVPHTDLSLLVAV